VTVAIDLPGQVENILCVLPNTKEIVVVTGHAGLGRLWLEQAQREFEPFAGRVRFNWFFDLPLAEIEQRVAALPPDTAILYGGLTVDAAGVPYERDEALDVLYFTANAPIFGLFDTEMGRGIVGGPLVSLAEASRRASDAALRILGGEAPETVAIEPVTMGAPVYDHRELERWSVPESRLPPGSSVRFRSPSAWEQYRNVFLGAAAIISLQTALIAGLLLQRSRRRAAEEQGRDLGRRLLTAHEDERRRLARELHDDLSQRLARLAIDAARMERTPTAAREEVSDPSMREELVRLSEDVHALSYQLHPSIIDDLGLREALDSECARFTKTEGIAAKIDSENLPDSLSPDASLCLFRVAQEALTNVSRHARASRVSVSVGPTEGGVRLVVRDDGIGFDGKEHRGRRSLGHASMKERVDLAGGKLEIQSRPSGGTTVSVWVPSRPDETRK
jgi:signal transduction histidine kinase